MQVYPSPCNPCRVCRFVIQDDGQIPEDTEAAIFQTLLRIKRQDPAIYRPDVAFFEEGDDDGDDQDEAEEGGSKRAKRPMYLKDMLAKQVGGWGARARVRVCGAGGGPGEGCARV